METRQERIAALARDILPALEPVNSNKKPQAAIKYYVFFLLFGCIFIIGYHLGECLKPINYDEYMTIHAMIAAKSGNQLAQQQELTRSLMQHFHIHALHELTSRQWSAALEYLANYGEF